MIKVAMADDHPLVRVGLQHLLAAEPDLELSAQADNGIELIQLLRQSTFDVVLMDMTMPGRSGLELLTQLKSEFPDLPVIVLSTYKEEMYAVRTIKAGASAYLCKDDAAENLVSAIRQVASGGRFITPEVASLMVNALQAPDVGSNSISLLSDREHQILLLMASDKTVTEIASTLFLSGKTVSTYKARIKIKLGLNSNAEIMNFAKANKLISEAQ
jgi:two-component system invasion response regulator UvrY